jgi:ubiquinone/menaquinone biosynthesis C-methylase UbiE
MLVARKVGAAGRVIGVDMTDTQLEKARQLAADAGIGTLSFQAGRIEQLPLDDSSADVVISNGVINLSPNKPTVFAEAARVLRPAGRLALADIVTESPLPAYLDTISRVGFAIETVRDNHQYRFLSESAINATAKWGVKSISLLARKTEDIE